MSKFPASLRVYLMCGFAVLALGPAESLAAGQGGAVYSPSKYSSGSQTGGIQEAIDAAAQAGGGTVALSPGTYVLHAKPGQPAVLLRSNVNIVGAGVDKTILVLDPKSLPTPGVIVNAHYQNPGAAGLDQNIVLKGFTLDLRAAEKIIGETRLTPAITQPGLQKASLEPLTPDIRDEENLLVEPGPNEEITAPHGVSPSGFVAFFQHPHPVGATVLHLVTREMGVALVGAENITFAELKIENAPMDCIYLGGTSHEGSSQSYCRHISIRSCSFIACYRNGISVIDASGVTIAENSFRGIIGDPGAAVDVEPNYPEQHGSQIDIRDNTVEDCFRGISLSLQLGGPDSANFRDERVVGNTISRTLFGFGILVLGNHAGATVWGNSVMNAAGDGILIDGSSNTTVLQNQIVNPGRCSAPRGCDGTADPAGIRLKTEAHFGPVISNSIQDNLVIDYENQPTLIYGIDLADSAAHNTIQGNTISRFNRARGAGIHSAGAASGANAFNANILK